MSIAGSSPNSIHQQNWINNPMHSNGATQVAAVQTTQVNNQQVALAPVAQPPQPSVGLGDKIKSFFLGIADKIAGGHRRDAFVTQKIANDPELCRLEASFERKAGLGNVDPKTLSPDQRDACYYVHIKVQAASVGVAAANGSTNAAGAFMRFNNATSQSSTIISQKTAETKGRRTSSSTPSARARSGSRQPPTASMPFPPMPTSTGKKSRLNRRSIPRSTPP